MYVIAFHISHSPLLFKKRKIFNICMRSHKPISNRYVNHYASRYILENGLRIGDGFLASTSGGHNPQRCLVEKYGISKSRDELQGSKLEEML